MREPQCWEETDERISGKTSGQRKTECISLMNCWLRLFSAFESELLGVHLCVKLFWKSEMEKIKLGKYVCVRICVSDSKAKRGRGNNGRVKGGGDHIRAALSDTWCISLNTGAWMPSGLTHLKQQCKATLEEERERLIQEPRKVFGHLIYECHFIYIYITKYQTKQLQ